jgi:hypothetical protein
MMLVAFVLETLNNNLEERRDKNRRQEPVPKVINVKPPRTMVNAVCYVKEEIT